MLMESKACWVNHSIGYHLKIDAYKTHLPSDISRSMSGGLLISPVDVMVTLKGAGGGLAGGLDVLEADAGEEEPTAESLLAEDSEPEVERRRGGAEGCTRGESRGKAAGMWRDAVITQLSSSEPPKVCGGVVW